MTTKGGRERLQAAERHKLATGNMFRLDMMDEVLKDFDSLLSYPLIVF